MKADDVKIAEIINFSDGSVEMKGLSTPFRNFLNLAV